MCSFSGSLQVTPCSTACILRLRQLVQRALLQEIHFPLGAAAPYSASFSLTYLSRGASKKRRMFFHVLGSSLDVEVFACDDRVS